MSLRKAKTLFCITAISVAVLLTAWGGLAGCAAGALVLGSALPGWRFVTRSASDQGASEALTVVKHYLRHRNL